MAKLPTLNKILSEDFSDLPWMPRLAAIINPFITEVVSALQNNLSIDENFNGDIRPVTIEGIFPLEIRWTRTNKPVAAFIGAIKRVDGTSVSLASAISLDWEYTNNGTIKINGVPGITSSSSNKYELNLVFLCG